MNGQKKELVHFGHYVPSGVLAHFRAWWTDVASEIIDCDPPGIASNDLNTFVFKKKIRKVFPLDKDAVYAPAGAKEKPAKAA